MTIHTDIFTPAFGTLLDVNGVSVQVRPENGTPVTLTAIVGLEEMKVEVEHGTRRRVFRRTVSFTKDDANRFGGFDNLQRNAVIRYGTTDYIVAAHVSESDQELCVQVMRSEVEERGREGASKKLSMI
jgi:hypothetical protein